MENTSGERSGDAAPLVGQLLDDRYRLDSVLARGGMATVYVATDTRLARSVAVKVMHRGLASDPDFVRRFTREAQAAARLNCPEVVAIHDAGKDPRTGLAYLVMEHVRGINLRQLLLERGALSPARAISLMEPVLRALAAAHAAGLVHRDIKPENVLLADDGRVKVADFGLARAVETSTMTQTTGLLIGTVAYLAPEQVQSGTADARSDVYAAGVLLWELLTGAPPYGGDSPLSVAYKHVHEDVPAPSTAVAGVPPALDALVVAATRRDPEARPADGGQFLAALELAAAPSPALATRHPTLAIPLATPPARPPRQRRQRRRRPGLVGLAMVLVLALVALGGGYYLGSYRYTKAPSAYSLTLPVATAKLQKAGFTVRHGKDRFSEVMHAGLVLTQDPKPGARVRKGGAVTLGISNGPDRRTVPAVTGTDPTAAGAALKHVRLAGSVTLTPEYSETVAKGLITRSDPPAGRKLKPGTTVQLFVSKGRRPVAVQYVSGKPYSVAKGTLEKAGFTVRPTFVFSDTVDKDLVIAQRPKSGTAVRGSAISLTVSKGPDVVSVPNVILDSPESAKRKLEAAGFVAQRQDAFLGTGSRVYNTDPGPGSKRKRGSTVRYLVV